MKRNKQSTKEHENAIFGDPVAGNGLLHRRVFLQGGVAFAGAAGSMVAAQDVSAAANIAQGTPASMRVPGHHFTAYGQPTRQESGVVRDFSLREQREGTGSSRTPHHVLAGTITPNGLHFERHHNGVPDIGLGPHELLIHGLVERPLVFSIDSLRRYPMETQICFVECAGNSGRLASDEPIDSTAGGIHGLLSCSEWTGIRLGVLLEEAGVDPRAKWILAEGADAAGMSRSIPLEKCWDDAILALYQNGEPIRPEQGYPVRLLLPGYEGNVSVKWLHRIKLTEGPVYTKDETSKYTDLLPSGRALMFTFDIGVKSFISQPSMGHSLPGHGTYEVTGLAWTGHGRIRRVEVSADAGQTWAEAALSKPVLPKALTRFRIPWKWNGQMAALISRATDESGNVQPSRDEWLSLYSEKQFYHYNGHQVWGVDTEGSVWNIYVHV